MLRLNSLNFIQNRERNQQFRLMENKKYEKTLIDQVKLHNTFYNYTTLQPCAYFWKQLFKGKQTPQLLVPDTLLLNDKQSPLMWIYTNSKGKLQKSTNINLKDFVNKITNYCSPNELAATLKRVTYNDNYINGNDVKLLNARYLQNASLQQLGGQSQTLITIQRYIKSNGNNPFICRTVWRKQKKSQCYVITNKKSYYDQNEPQAKRFLVKVAESSKGQASPSTIVKTIQGKHLTETCKYLSNITDFMKLYRGIIFTQIVGDFIKDEAGNWWLLNIKAFQIENNNVRSLQLANSRLEPMNEYCEKQSLQVLQKQGVNEPYEKQKYQKTKICRYCEKSYLQSELNHYMTIRMLIETDRYLLHLGKNYKWLRRSDIQNVDTHCLYQQHKICERCYRLYMEIQELMEVENQFLKSLGYQMDKKPKELLMSLTNQAQLKTESKNKELITLASCSQNRNCSQIQSQNNDQRRQNITNFPKTIELGPNSNIIFDGDVPIKNDHMINKMIRYRLILYLKELDQVEFPDFLKQEHQSYHFYVEYELFGVKNKMKLDFGNNFDCEKKVLSIKKLKINYFFSHSHQDVHEYLNAGEEDFCIKIIAQHKNSKGKNLDSMTTKTVSMKMKNSEKICGEEGESAFERSGSKRKVQKKYTIMKVERERQKRIVLGRLRLPIKEFFNSMLNNNANKITKKDFYKFFSVNEVPHGWGLEGSIGIIPTESYVNTARMIFFTQDNLIYLPNDNYYFCEHLPEQWIDLIKKELIQAPKINNIQSHSVNQSQTMDLYKTQEDSKDLKGECLKFKHQLKENQKENHKPQDKFKPNNTFPQQKDNRQNSVQKKKETKLGEYSEQQENRESSPIDESKINRTRDSWKDHILKEEIKKYDKASQIKGTGK